MAGDRPWEASSYDAVVVGAGPNGLAAAIELARAGHSVLLVEAKETAGGGARSGQITAPGFVHDICSAVHPFALASPFFSDLKLGQWGLEWVQPPAPLAHVLGDGRAVLLERSVEETAKELGPDEQAYCDLIGPFAERGVELLSMVLAGLRFPSSPVLFARFGLSAMRSMRDLARSRFSGEAAPALLAGIAAHSMVPLERQVTASFALALAVAGHSVGWPIARGGSQAITDALVRIFSSHGGELVTGFPVRHIGQLPAARAYLFDVSPGQLLAIAGDRLSDGYRRRLSKFRHGPGVFKLDWALSGPIPWKDAACVRTATVHLGGDLERVARSEARVKEGHSPREPFVLVVQPTLFDASRAPTGNHTAWAYCHLPSGSEFDATAVIERTIEGAAPGFGERIIAKRSASPGEVESYNPNYVGGDIGGGATDLGQLFFRPTVSLDPYATSDPSIFLCSASTPPGPGVHGMCGYWAARSVLSRGLPSSP